MTVLMALAHLSVTTVTFSNCLARFRDVCRVMAHILRHNRGASSTCYRLKFNRTATTGRSRGLIAEKIVDLRGFRVVLRICRIVTLVSVHFGVLRASDTVLLFD